MPQKSLTKLIKEKTKNLDATKMRVPQSTAGFDLAEDPTWRIFRIMSEFVDGFQFLSQFKKEVTFFGSARFSPQNKYSQIAKELGKKLSQAGYTIITGGGPGIMEAGNKGAIEGKNGDSIGLNIQLPFEQRTNKHVNKGLAFHYFFTRKVMLSASAQAYVFFPGGFGTLDEFFEIITLIQTQKITENVPVIIIGKNFWQPLMHWIEKIVYKENKAVSKKDMKIYTLVNTVEQAFKIISKSKERNLF